MDTVDANLLVLRYLRRLDEVAAEERLPHTYRNELVGEVRERVQAALQDASGDRRATRTVLREMGSPEAMIAAVAGLHAQDPLEPRISKHAVGAVICSGLWLAGLGSLAGLVLAHRALALIRLSDGRLYGESMALTAIFVGWVGLALPVVFALQ